MLSMFSALEARATAYLLTPEDYSLYQHIEIRITDSVQHGGTSILYGGKFNNRVIDALRALGYQVTILLHENKEQMLRISWDKVVCPKEDILICQNRQRNLQK